MNLYFFNPGCELEVSNGDKNYSLQRFPQILENDLETIPMFMAKKNDYILVSKKIDENFINFWKSNFCTNFVTIDELEKSNIDFDNFLPWGISPRVFNIVKNIKFNNNFFSQGFTSCQKKLFSRQTSAEFFKNFITEFYDEKLFPHKEEIPQIITNKPQAMEYFQNGFKALNQGVVFKAIFSSSGRGVRIFRRNTLSDNILQWIDFAIKTQGAIECEPYYNKIADFSLHYDIENSKAKFVGISNFKTTYSGFYQSSIIEKNAKIPNFKEEILEKLVFYQKKILDKSIYTKSYFGSLGIDCMVYSTVEGLKINPCVEINCRNSMGRISMALAVFLEENVKGEFFVYQHKNCDKRFLEKPIFSSNGLLKSGFLKLTKSDTEIFSAGILAGY